MEEKKTSKRLGRRLKAIAMTVSCREAAKRVLEDFKFNPEDDFNTGFEKNRVRRKLLESAEKQHEEYRQLLKESVLNALNLNAMVKLMEERLECGNVLDDADEDEHGMTPLDYLEGALDVQMTSVFVAAKGVLLEMFKEIEYRTVFLENRDLWLETIGNLEQEEENSPSQVDGPKSEDSDD